jgi:hypothetical protein
VALRPVITTENEPWAGIDATFSSSFEEVMPCATPSLFVKTTVSPQPTVVAAGLGPCGPSATVVATESARPADMSAVPKTARTT